VMFSRKPVFVTARNFPSGLIANPAGKLPTSTCEPAGVMYFPVGKGSGAVTCLTPATAAAPTITTIPAAIEYFLDMPLSLPTYASKWIDPNIKSIAPRDGSS
jgi:hypothetical protein